MMKTLTAVLLFVVSAAFAQTTPAPPKAAEEAQPDASNLTITYEALGDSDAGVVIRATFRFTVPEDVPAESPLTIQGSLSQDGMVIKTFRYPLQPSQRNVATAIFTVKPGEVEIDAKLMIPLEEQAPVIVGKSTKKITLTQTGKSYIASSDDGAEAIIAEGIVPETVGAVRILSPRRDVAPNLFIVDVAVQAPVKKLEFWVDGKKVLTKNAPPYKTELDLGKLPKRVEVRVVGYDNLGRYVDADAFIVNERETPLEVRITRTQTPDGTSHFKLSIQNPKQTQLKKIELYAGQKKIYEWTRPPYAISIPDARLAGVDFLRASVIDETNYEASDLLFLSGDRYTEEIDVNIVELPVSVTDAAGVPISGLTKDAFTVLENNKPQKIEAFNYSANLPLSLGMLIDYSGSMEKRMKPTKEAAGAFFKSIMKPGDRAFVAGFAFEASKLAPFASESGILQAQVDAIPEAGGGTALYDAIVTGLYRFRNVQGRKALVILTDGEDTTSRLPYEEMLLYARSARVPLYFIGIDLGFGDMAGTGKMKTLAAETGGVAYFIRKVEQLKETYDQLEKELRSQYLVSYYTHSTKKDQAYRTVEVKVNHPGAKVRTIRGFIP